MVRKNTLILVGVFAALVLVLVLLQRSPEETPEELADFPTSPPVVSLFDFGSQTVAGLAVRNLDGNEVVMVLNEGNWSLTSASATQEETDGQRINNAVTQIATMRVLNDGAIQAAPRDLGLEFPSHEITITLSDGGVHVISVGRASVTNRGYYVIVDGGEPQLVTKSTLDQLIGLLGDPPLLPTPIPEPVDEATPEAPEAP